MSLLRSLTLGALALALAVPAAAQARLQIIHNAADPAAAEVDVYVNGTLALNDFAFRSATPFLGIAPGTYDIAIAPGTSASAGDAVFTETYTLANGSATQLIANGVLSPGGFADNPDGVAIAFELLVGASAQTAASGDDQVAVRVVHGATDAPTVDVRTGGAVLVDDASYTDVTDYLSVPADDYVLDVTMADGAPVASFTAPLANAGGAAVTVLASGFLDPSANQDGAAFGLLAVFADGTELLLPAATSTARLQVIHNAADPAAAEVDVYVNGGLLLDDFAFRTATPFIDVDAGVDLEVAIAPGTSTGAGDALFTQTFNLPVGSTTQLIANGVLSPGDFAANPDGIDIAFELLVGGNAQEDGSGGVAVRVVHGATDAPTVDVRTGGAVLVDDASYTDVTGYLTVAPADYVLDVTLADGTPVASFDAPLALPDTAVTVLASGFLDPSANQGGAAFGLLAVFPDGLAVLLPAATPTARLQVIHNAADPAAAEVDVYVNGGLLLDDFAFRTATPFIDVDAGVDLEVAIAPGTSTGVGDALFTQTFNLPDGSTTQLIANGVLTPGDFADNPDGIDIAFELLVGAEAQEAAAAEDKVAIRVVHGATDAPTVDVRTGGAVLVDDASYTDVTGYLEVDPADYVLDVTLADGTPVVSFTAPLADADGAAVTVLASGFLTPSANQDGAGFGLLAVFPDGSAVLLPVATDSEGDAAGDALTLGAVAPNPLRGAGAVSFSLDAPGTARLALYDALGRQVAVLADGEFSADLQTARLDTAGLAAGVYVLRLDAASGARTQTLTVVR